MNIKTVLKISICFFMSLSLYATSADVFRFQDTSSYMKVKNDAQMRINTLLSVNHGLLVTEENGAFVGLDGSSKFSFTEGKFAIGAINTIGAVDIGVTGDYLLQDNIFLANGGTFLSTNLGELPVNILVSGIDNALVGSPELQLPVQFFDSSSTLSIGIQSALHQNIILNSGTLYVIDTLAFGKDAIISGSGNVVLGSERLELGQFDAHWTSSLTFIGDANINLNARVNLSGIWTFSGFANIGGSGNVLDLSQGGTIFIRSNSTVNLSSIGIEGLGSGRLIFEDTTSKLVTQNTSIALNSDYTFTTGGIYVAGNMLVVTFDHLFKFEQNSSLTVDGGTLWYDTVIFTDSLNVRPIAADNQNLTLLRNGVVRNVQSASNPAQLSPSGDFEVFVNSILDATRNLNFQKTSPNPGVQEFVYKATFHDISFARVNAFMLIAGPDTAVTFKEIVFREFSPDYILSQTAVGASPGSFIYGDQVVLELAFANDLATTLTFQGNTAIDGKGQILTLVNGGNIVVTPNSTLTLRDVTIKGLVDNNVRCMGDTAKLILENATLIYDLPYSFTAGSFKVSGNTTFAGTSIFSYETDQTSTILNNSALTIDRGATFHYAPSSSNRQLITFLDKTGQLVMNGATLSSTSTGINLVGGTLRIKDDNRFISLATNNAEAIKLGNGLADASDLTVTILPGAHIDFVSGYFDM